MICALLAVAAAGLLEQGEQLYRQHKFEQARTVFQRVVKQEPSLLRGRLWLGYSELALGNFEAAIRTLEPLEKTFASNYEFLFYLSEAYTRQARELSNRIAELGDQSARAHQLLAYRYRAEGDVRNAESELRRAIELRPDIAGLNLDLGNLLWEQQRHDEAAQAMVAELKIQPNDFMANLRYGQYLLLQWQPEKARGPLEIAARHKAYPEAFQLLAYAHQKFGDLRQARAVLNAGVRLFPREEGLSEMKAQLNAGSAEAWNFEPLRSRPPAVSELRAKLAAGSSGEDDLFLLSQHYSERGQMLAERLQRIGPNSYRTLQLKGLSAEYAGKWAEAEAFYRQALKARPDLPGAHSALGLVLLAQGRDTEAAQELRAELALDPKNHLALFQLGTWLLKKGEVAEAVQTLNAAHDLRPDFGPGLLELGRALLQARQPADAAKHLEQLVAKESNHPSAHFVLYRVYLLIGAKDKAASHLRIHQSLLQKRGAADSAGMR